MAQTVAVGCKLPNGLIIHMGAMSEAGDRFNITHKVELKGANDSEIVGGFGITHVDKELWDAWIAKNKDFAPVKAGIIFAQENEGRAKAVAKEREKEKSGFEGIDPDKPGMGVKKADTK